MDVSLWPESWGFLSKVTFQKCQTGLLPLACSSLITPACLHHGLQICLHFLRLWRESVSSLFSSKTPDLVFLLALFACQGLEMDGASTR